MFLIQMNKNEFWSPGSRYRFAVHETSFTANLWTKIGFYEK